jgi:NAD(P)-dependent dehydrogenase (short-subunit alcohol dehydrogenase family)
MAAAASSRTLHILITGCSAGGIGSALASSLASRGHHVFATLRNPSKISPELSSLSNVTVLALDVTDSSSIASAVESVAKVTGGKGLDILVNNAGIGYTMPLVDTDIEEGKRLFDTNVWGALAMTKAFMDLLVQASGAVVNISSVGGEVNTPWHGKSIISFSLSFEIRNRDSSVFAQLHSQISQAYTPPPKQPQPS